MCKAFVSNFGNNGIVARTTFPNTNTAKANAIIINQLDGKIVAAGQVQNTGNSFNAFVRYNSDGSLDTTFGNGGLVVNDISPSTDEIYNLALQTDGKIVAAGRVNNASFALARYNTNGSLDSTFGVGGVTSINGSIFDVLNVQIQPDNRLLAVSGSSFGFFVARFNINGSLDSSFGVGEWLLLLLAPVLVL